jgi:integrase
MVKINDGRGRYRRQGKIENPTTDKEFTDGMNTGHFVNDVQRAYCVLLFYSGVRRGEALEVKREQFQITDEVIMYDVGERLKHSKETSSLTLPLSSPFMEELKILIENTKQGKKLFPFCSKTAYNIIRRVFHYPHLFRLTRITWFFQQGYTIDQVKSWTGLTLAALDYYVGKVDTHKMGMSLSKIGQGLKVANEED